MSAAVTPTTRVGLCPRPMKDAYVDLDDAAVGLERVRLKYGPSRFLHRR